MQVMDILAGAQGGEVVANIARTYGIEPHQAEAVVRAVLPEVARRVERNTFSRGGLADMVAAMGAARQTRVLDDPAALANPAVRQLGIAFLDQIFAGKDGSRAVAARASAASGISEALIKQMLPIVVSLIVGALAKGGGGALGDIIARIPGGGSPRRAGGDTQSRPPGSDIPPLPGPLPGGGMGGGGSDRAGGSGASPLPLPPDDMPEMSGSNPYGDLTDIIRKGGPAVTAGGGLFAIIRSLLGTLLGFQNRGIVGWLVRLVVMRWGWGLLRAILGRMLSGRR
jgi:hypothetical protein